MAIYKDIKINPAKFEICLNYPFIVSDYNAYRIITDLEDADAITVTALRADGTVVSCTSGAGGCVLSNALYAIEGDIVLNVSVSDAAGSVVTENKIYATVESGANADTASNTAAAATIAAQAAALAAKAMARVNNTYSTTPQQIGTWIDGTPVWRVAIDYLLSAVDADDLNNGAGIVFLPLIVRNYDQVNVLITFNLNVYSDGTLFSTLRLECDGGAAIDRSLSDCSAGDKVCGYIDFVTAAENIAVYGTT